MSGISSSKFDGLIGMAFPRISQGRIPTFFQHLLEQDLIDEASFSLYISEKNSAIVLGGIDPRFNATEFTFFPLLQTGYWSVEGHGLIINDEEFRFSDSPLIAIFDSGTSRIVASVEIVDFVARMTGLESNVAYEPRIVHDLPTIWVQFGDELVAIPPKAYMLCLEAFCIFGFEGSSHLPSPNFMILGDLFLRTYYTLFDYGRNRIGLSVAADYLEE